MSTDIRLPDATWLEAPAPRTVIQGLEKAGYRARVVGGCVRDSLLGHPIGDIDVATDAEPEAVMAALSDVADKVVPTGVDHGTVTVVVDGIPIEVTTLRHDVETFGRHAKVAFTDDWKADAERRDFTLNALYADLDGAVYDPVGGLSDIRARRVRFIGDPHERIREDALRILRFFRFHAWFGKGAPDAAALAACGERRADLRLLSAERVAGELLKLLAAPDPVPALAAMEKAGVTAVLFPEGTALALLQGLVSVESSLSRPDPVRRLAAWWDGEAELMARRAEALRLSGRDRERILSLANPRTRFAVPMAANDIRRYVYRLGRQHFIDLLLLSAADEPAGESALVEAVETAESWPVPKLPLKGRDVVAAGIPKGPKVGEILEKVERWWVEADFPDDRAAALAHLAAVLGEEEG